jgi:hypothetical protein
LIQAKIGVMTGGVWREWALVLLAAAACAGQSSQISGPVSGYVFDGARREVRPILGIPGASTIGRAMDFGFAVSAAYVAPRQDAALVTAADGTVHLFQIQSGSAAELVLNGLTIAPERVVFSPSGTAAALYHSGSIEILNGLTHSSIVTSSFELTTAGVPQSMALSDDGALLLVASGRSIELFASGANLGTLTDTAGPAAVTFAPGKHDAAVADPLGAGIVWFRDLTGVSDSQVVAVPDDTIQAATAVAFLADGHSLLVASPAGKSVIALNLADGTRTAIPCACAPTALAPMGSRFRLNEFGADPLWLLDTQRGPARIVFVPAVPDPGPAPRP